MTNPTDALTEITRAAEHFESLAKASRAASYEVPEHDHPMAAALRGNAVAYQHAADRFNAIARRLTTATEESSR